MSIPNASKSISIPYWTERGLSIAHTHDICILRVIPVCPRISLTSPLMLLCAFTPLSLFQVCQIVNWRQLIFKETYLHPNTLWFVSLQCRWLLGGSITVQYCPPQSCSPLPPHSPPVLLAPKEFLALGQKKQSHPHLGPLKIPVSTLTVLPRDFLKRKLPCLWKDYPADTAFSLC